MPDAMALLPEKVELVDTDNLRIYWNDGQVLNYRVADLRKKCPCATCREMRNAPPPPPGELLVLSPGETQPARIVGMHPIGNYAYGIEFSDGHDTGIYSLTFLREIGAAE
ncbi:MAG: DUF971 domain-containing protein [Planctomycetales bacterium]|nr:DUF971 domain-containing protein [Planctomycetales bacterium]